MLASHDRFTYSPITERPDFTWPDGRRLAIHLSLNLEHFAYNEGLGLSYSPGLPHPNTYNWAWREYGNRVGVWRLIEMCDALHLPMSVLLNSEVYDHCPKVVEALRKRGDEILGHGRSNAENLRGLWQPDEERLLREVTDTITKHEGRPPRGWMGAGAYETTHTPDLLKEIGYTYLMDWPMDDQPVWLRTRTGPMLLVPYPVETDDAQAIIHRKWSAAVFCDMLVAQFDEMIGQSARHPLVMNVSVHPYVFGQPFRVRALRRALQHCLRHPLASRVWWTKPGDIANHCLALPPGIIPGS